MRKARYLESLLQLLDGPVWDGDVISKAYRDELVKVGYVYHCHGYAILSPMGVEVLKNLGAIE